MKKEYKDLYQKYRDKALNRRDFLKKLGAITGGTAAAVALLSRLEAAGGRQIIPVDDQRIETGYIHYPAAEGKMRAYRARPAKSSTHPGVIVIHENKGLRPQTEDVARRLALEGYLAVAPDALTPLGGAPADAETARNLMRSLDRNTTRINFIAAVEYLKTHPQTTGKVACMGFCWGGGMTNQVAVHSPELDVAVPFYGRQPDPRDVPRIKAALLCHYAEKDERINAGIPLFEAALQKAGIDYRMYMYEGAGHAFFNDTRPDRYHPESARLAWERTLAFFKEKLA
jgi:carboxymethylenebutenolidase